MKAARTRFTCQTCPVRGQWVSTLTCISITWRAFERRPPHVSDLVGLWWTRTFAFLTSPRDADMAGPETALGEPSNEPQQGVAHLFCKGPGDGFTLLIFFKFYGSRVVVQQRDPVIHTHTIFFFSKRPRRVTHKLLEQAICEMGLQNPYK